jgi:hypothetical protein
MRVSNRKKDRQILLTLGKDQVEQNKKSFSKIPLFSQDTIKQDYFSSKIVNAFVVTLKNSRQEVGNEKQALTAELFEIIYGKLVSFFIHGHISKKQL